MPIVTTRPPRGVLRLPEMSSDAGARAAVLEDAAHFPGGETPAVAWPETEAEIAALLATGSALLPVGAQSSLTGGATPRGEIVVSSARWRAIGAPTPDRVRVQCGVTLDELQAALDAAGLFYAPAPTWTGATCGGVVATNAAGPHTFKYGTTRDWVLALTVVLASGDVLDLERGQAFADQRGAFTLRTASGDVVVPVPRVRRPAVPKCSAGYFGAPGMDLVDLFIGSEGTLAVITELTLRVVATPAARCLALMLLPDMRRALELAGALRAASIETRRSRDPQGIDVSAIEHLDRRSTELLREDGADRRHGIDLPRGTDAALIAELELSAPVSRPAAWTQVEGALVPGTPDTPLVRFCRLLDRFDALDSTTLALPGDHRRRTEIAALREAVPALVNARIARAQREVDPAISKMAGDVIVPFARFGELLDACDEAFASRDLDGAVWGHISDGNVHPNVIPVRAGDGVRGREAILEIGRAALDLGGCPLAEHGVGRNAVKLALLEMLHGPAGLESMRAVKRALDPRSLLAPGVLIGEAGEQP